MRLIYLAAPLSAPERTGREGNLNRARRLRDVLEADPLRMVYLPHERIAAVHGYPAADETPEVRAAALDQCFAALRAVLKAGGELHVLLREDGWISDGCSAEIEHWLDMGGEGLMIWRANGLGFEGVRK
jgi:hypothetical protein